MTLPTKQDMIRASAQASAMQDLTVWKVELVKKVEGKSKAPVSGKYCGCDSECFTSCNNSYNRAISDILSIIKDS